LPVGQEEIVGRIYESQALGAFKKGLKIGVQPDISIIKEEKLKDSQKLKPNSCVTIKGIAAGDMTTIGATTLTILFEEKCGLEHEFQIVKRHFPFEFDGIIVRDFLTRYRCLIDYDKFLLNFKHEGFLFEIPLVEEIYILPPRSEIICQLKAVINQDLIILAEVQIRNSTSSIIRVIVKLIESGNLRNRLNVALAQLDSGSFKLSTRDEIFKKISVENFKKMGLFGPDIHTVAVNQAFARAKNHRLVHNYPGFHSISKGIP
jgi:hypothetical protein